MTGVAIGLIVAWSVVDGVGAVVGWAVGVTLTPGVAVGGAAATPVGVGSGTAA